MTGKLSGGFNPATVRLEWYDGFGLAVSADGFNPATVRLESDGGKLYEREYKVSTPQRFDWNVNNAAIDAFNRGFNPATVRLEFAVNKETKIVTVGFNPATVRLESHHLR